MHLGDEWVAEVYPCSEPGTREYIIEAVLMAQVSVLNVVEETSEDHED